jgi:sec-independent protein translocase protein TatB
MFDISFPELVVVGVIALLVLGPNRLPGALRTLGLWVGRMSRTFSALKTEIEREIGMDEIRRQLHNEAVMDELKRIERDVRGPTSNGSGHAEVKDPEPPQVEAPPAQVSATSNDTRPHA